MAGLGSAQAAGADTLCRPSGGVGVLGVVRRVLARTAGEAVIGHSVG